MSAQEVKSFDITIPATVTTGTPVDVSLASAKGKSLFLPAGSGKISIYVAGSAEGVYAFVASVTLKTEPQVVELNSPNFGWIRLDRVTRTGELTAQLVGQPSQTGADGRDKPQGQVQRNICVGNLYAFDKRDAVFNVTSGTLVTGSNGIATDGGDNASSLDIIAFDASGNFVGCVGRFVLNADVNGKVDIAMTLQGCTAIPAGANLFYKLCTVAGSGATIAEGAFVKLS